MAALRSSSKYSDEMLLKACKVSAFISSGDKEVVSDSWTLLGIIVAGGGGAELEGNEFNGGAEGIPSWANGNATLLFKFSLLWVMGEKPKLGGGSFQPGVADVGSSKITS